MGYMRHHAIIVTSWDDSAIQDAHDKAREVFGKEGGTAWADLVGPIIPSITNGYHSFLIAPDGSKEGWDTSDTGNVAREVFLDWLDELRYDDDSSRFDWVEVQYGDDDMVTEVTRDSDLHRRRRWATGRGPLSYVTHR